MPQLCISSKNLVYKYGMSEWKSLSCVWLFVTPWTVQAMEFSRLEYWSGSLFPSSGDLPTPGIEPRSPALQAYSLPAEPPGKPLNTGVGSLSFLQGIFLTQESNRSLLCHGRILYQLSYQGKPSRVLWWRQKPSSGWRTTKLGPAAYSLCTWVPKYSCRVL